MKIKNILFLTIFTIIFAQGVYSIGQHQPVRPLTLDQVVDQLSEGMDETNYSRVYNAVAEVDPRDFPAFINKVNELCTVIDELDDIEEVWIIEVLSKIKPVNYQTFTTMVNNLSQGMEGEYKVGVIVALSRVDPINYQPFINKLNEFLTEVEKDEPLEGGEKIAIIEAVAGVDPVTYPALTATVNNLSVEMRSSLKGWVIGALRLLNPINYLAFTRMINQLSVRMNELDKAYLIARLAKVNPLDYGTAIVLGCQIPNAQARDIALERFSNTDSYTNTNAEQQTLKTARALLFCRWLANNQQRAQRVLQILETPLVAPIPSIGAEVAGLNPYAAGVNVHAGDRDKKTQQAYDLLLSLWDPTPEEIENYSNALIHYVEASGNAKAIRALTGRGRTTNDFGALLQSADQLRVRTRLAHLWHFAIKSSAVIGSNETRLAAESIITALADAVEADDHLVCNPGKHQRLATAVLQGRLQGVKIDDTPIPADVRLVPINAEILANIAREEATVTPAPERIRVIRNLDAIEEYLKPLTNSWMYVAPTRGTDLLRQTFNYIVSLARGEVPGTDGRRIFLDPRDVIFHLIFGKGVRSEGGTLANTLLVDELNVDDYVAQYQAKEQAAYREAKAEIDRRALIATQNAAYARAKAMDRAKQEAEKKAAAEAIRISEEVAAKMAEEEASRREAQHQIELERKRLAALTPQQRRALMAAPYDKDQLAAGRTDDIDVIMKDISAENVATAAAPAPTPIIQATVPVTVVQPAAISQEFAQDKRGVKRPAAPSQAVVRQPGKLARTGSTG